MSHRAHTRPEPDDDELLRRLSRAPLPVAPSDAGPEPSHPRRQERGRTAPHRARLLDRCTAIAVRTGVTPRAVVGVVLVGTVVAAVLLVRLLLVQHQARPVPLRMAATGSAGGPATSPPAGTSPAPSGSGATEPGASSVPGAPSSGSPTASAATATVLVHVVGEVRHAGVVRLPAGARVEQALDAAGGATAKADLVRVNLARVVVDGEQIVVPRPGQVVAGAPAAGGPSAVPGATGGAVGTVLDLNTAGLAELDALPGVGPVLAQRILDWRSENGRFTSVDELGEVSGIGDKVLDRLRALVRV